MLFCGSTQQEEHLYFHLLNNAQNKNSPEVEKSSGPFETSLKETSLDSPNKASLWRGKINLFTLLVEKQASQRDGACTNNLDFHQGNSHIE